jgi:lysine 6-dehydrogenase
MKALVLGVGMQGKAVIHDLSESPFIKEIIAADVFPEAVEEHVQARGYSNVRVVGLDATKKAKLISVLKAAGVGIVVCMVPPQFSHSVARACLEAGVHFVSTSLGAGLADLDEAAKARGITILPDIGFDPGIDLLLGSLAVDELDKVEGLYSYAGGVPAPECVDNLLNYRITWVFDRVLLGYKREARMLKGGREVSIPGLEIFNQEHIHLIEFPGVGTLEAFPNGDALTFIDSFSLGPGLKELARFTLRWPGHAAYWRIMAQMGFLEDEPLELGGGSSISPRQFLIRHLAPRLQLKAGERDLAVLRVQAWGYKDHEKLSVIFELADYLDPETGLTAMNRTVGYTASIAAQMILSKEIRRSGVLSPARDVPVRRLLEELKARNIQTYRRVEELSQDMKRERV